MTKLSGENASVFGLEAPEFPDEKAMLEALAFLEQLASGLFPNGDLDFDLLSWSERLEQRRESSDHPESAEERLKVAEARFLTLVEQIPAVTFMAVLGEGENDVYVSPHIEQMLGYTQDEWLSDPFLWYYRLHPEDRARWNEEFTRGVRTGGPFRAECRFLARDGRAVWVHGEARLVKDDRGRPQFLQGVAFDITESKRAQEVLLQNAVTQAKADEDLAIARRVQTSLLPTSPSLPGLEISALMEPADEVGGDYYDVRAAGDGGFLIVGDVSGHGLDAGLVMLMMQSAAFAITCTQPEIAPQALLGHLNTVLHDNLANRLHRNEYVTLTVLRYHADGSVQFAGAHQTILVLRAADGSVERLETEGPWLGIRDDITGLAQDQGFQLEPGDTLLLYTDGVIEAANATGELFDLPRLIAALEECKGLGPEAVRDHLRARVKAFAQKLDDDMTLMVARYNGR